MSAAASSTATNVPSVGIRIRRRLEHERLQSPSQRRHTASTSFASPSSTATSAGNCFQLPRPASRREDTQTNQPDTMDAITRPTITEATSLGTYNQIRDRQRRRYVLSSALARVYRDHRPSPPASVGSSSSFASSDTHVKRRKQLRRMRDAQVDTEGASLDRDRQRHRDVLSSAFQHQRSGSPPVASSSSSTSSVSARAHTHFKRKSTSSLGTKSKRSRVGSHAASQREPGASSSRRVRRESASTTLTGLEFLGVQPRAAGAMAASPRFSTPSSNHTTDRTDNDVQYIATNYSTRHRAMRDEFARRRTLQRQQQQREQRQRERERQSIFAYLLEQVTSLPDDNPLETLQRIRMHFLAYVHSHRTADPLVLRECEMILARLDAIQQRFASASRNHGASQHSIDQLPVSAYDDIDYDKLHVTEDGVIDLTLMPEPTEKKSCCVCLEDFEAGCKIKTLPCFHIFHGDCISPWLQRKAACPVCRTAVPK